MSTGMNQEINLKIKKQNDRQARRLKYGGIIQFFEHQ